MQFIRTISGWPNSGKAKTVLTSGATTEDYEVACFLMKMQDDGKSLNDAKAYARIGPMMMPGIDWTEVNRVLGTF